VKAYTKLDEGARRRRDRRHCAATPAEQPPEWNGEAAQGKHLFVEKPLALEWDDGMQMTEGAKAAYRI